MTTQPATAAQLRAAWREDDEAYGPDDQPLFELVHEETEPDDHGYGFHLVFKRNEDDTYWSVSGVSQNGNDYNSFRDGDEDTVTRVWPHRVTTTEYLPKEP
jgi:hypothetical protein